MEVTSSNLVLATIFLFGLKHHCFTRKKYKFKSYTIRQFRVNLINTFVPDPVKRLAPKFFILFLLGGILWGGVTVLQTLCLLPVLVDQKTSPDGKLAIGLILEPDDPLDWTVYSYTLSPATWQFWNQKQIMLCYSSGMEHHRLIRWIDNHRFEILVTENIASQSSHSFIINTNSPPKSCDSVSVLTAYSKQTH